MITLFKYLQIIVDFIIIHQVNTMEVTFISFFNDILCIMKLLKIYQLFIGIFTCHFQLLMITLFVIIEL